MARHTWFRTGFCLALLACGDKPPAEAPAANVTVAPARDAGAIAPPSALDAGLPKGAAWLGSLDAGAFADLLSNPQVMMLASSAVRLDLSMLADLGVDPSGSIQIAQIGLNDAQRAGLAAMVGGSGDFGAVTKTMTPFDPTFRVVIPVKDAAKAKAAASRFVAAMGDGIDTEVAAENGVLVVDVSFTGRSKMSKQNLADLHALVKAGHADVARGPNEALHVVYRPSDLAQLGAYLQLEMAAGAIGGESLDVSQMKRIASAGVDAAKKLVALIGTPEKSAFDRVDIFGRLVAKKLTFELRATPGAAPNLPPADAWKPGPSIAPDGNEGYITYARPFVSAWQLTGDPPNVPFTKSTVSTAVLGPGPTLAADLPFGIPLFAHLTARSSNFSDNVFARFDRAGLFLASDGSVMDVGLLSRTITAAEAACLLSTKTPCPVAERLKPGAPAVAIALPYQKTFGRLLTVKGTTQLALAMGPQMALDALKLHATTADPLDGSSPQELGGSHGVTIPWITASQRLVLDARLDGNTIRATLTPAP